MCICMYVGGVEGLDGSQVTCLVGVGRGRGGGGSLMFRGRQICVGVRI